MATATKKSPAYDKGYREGKADKAKKPAPVMESPEGEEEESPEEEEMDAAKGRKRDGGYMKTPMDGSYGKKSMDATCTCGAKSRKGKKCSCGAGKKDGMCGSARKMDSLTAPEYLDACELGINRRSNSYIRARLDAEKRLDLKCGKGAISQGEKCKKGAATAVREYQNKVKNTPWLMKGGIWDPEIAGSTRGQTVRRTALQGAKVGLAYGTTAGTAIGAAGGPGGAAAGAGIGAVAGTAYGASVGAIAGSIKSLRPKGTGSEATSTRSAMTGGLLGPKRRKQIDSIYATGFNSDQSLLNI